MIIINYPTQVADITRCYAEGRWEEQLNMLPSTTSFGELSPKPVSLVPRNHLV